MATKIEITERETELRELFSNVVKARIAEHNASTKLYFALLHYPDPIGHSKKTQEEAKAYFLQSDAKYADAIRDAVTEAGCKGFQRLDLDEQCFQPLLAAVKSNTAVK